MRTGAGHYRRCFAAARAGAFLLLISALLAPKVSLAVAATLGTGYSSVIICTGSGLARVSLSPQGDVVDDVSDAWVSAHCVLQDSRTAELQRAWQRTAFPGFVAVAQIDEQAQIASFYRLQPAISNRGPPSRS